MSCVQARTGLSGERVLIATAVSLQGVMLNEAPGKHARFAMFGRDVAVIASHVVTTAHWQPKCRQIPKPRKVSGKSSRVEGCIRAR